MQDYLVRIVKGTTCRTYEVFEASPEEAQAKLLAKKGAEEFTPLWVCANLVHLQGVGWTPGILGSELQVGDAFRWNGGSTSEIKAILSSTSAFITFQVEEGGQLYERRRKKTAYAPVTVETFDRWVERQGK